MPTATGRVRCVLVLALLLGGSAGLGAASASSVPPAAPDETATAEPAGTGGDATDREAPRVCHILVEGEIDLIQSTYFERSVRQARAAGADVIVTEIDSPGGSLGAALEMSDLALEEGGPRMVAFSHEEAISAAAMLAYSHAEVHLAPDVLIGNIGVIFITSEGMEYAPEKVNTYVRGHHRKIVQRRHWPEALLLKMTDRNKRVYEARFADGRTEYVSERDAERFLADHPEIAARQDDPEDDSWVQIYGEDELLTFTGSEAVAKGMATGTAEDLDALYERLGVERDQVIDLAPTTSERIARSLSGFAGLFLGLAILFILFEFKTPGVGIFAALGGICFLLFIVCQYYLDFANHFEIVLMVLGILLAAADLWYGLSGGPLTAVGALVFCLGMVMGFLPDTIGFDWDDPRFGKAVDYALFNSALAVGIMAIGFIVLLFALPKLPFVQRLSVGATIAGTSAGEEAPGGDPLIGRVVTVAGQLHPGGTVRVDGAEHSAVAEDGMMVAAGEEVEIVRRSFGELVVRPVRPPPAEATGDDEEATA